MATVCNNANMEYILSKELYDELKEDWHVSENDNLSRRLDTLLARLCIPPSYTIIRGNLLHYTRSQAKTMLHDFLEKQYSEMEVPVIREHPTLPDALVLPCTGPKEDIARHNREVIVDLACGVAVLRGANVFAPGVMGAPHYLAVGQAVSVYADVQNNCRRGCTNQYKGAKYFIGNGTAMMSRQDLFCVDSKIHVGGIAVQMTNRVYETPCLNSVLPNVIMLQNLPSIVCGHVLDPKPGETVLDMCAAPGGKATHIASLMNDTGQVVAIDKSKAKVKKIEYNTKRLNLSCIKAYAFDATKAVTEIGKEENVYPPFKPETFDKVLLDAPCSALGQRPQLRNNMKLSELRSFPCLQRKLLWSAVRLLKVGGTLVYSTCTITAAENEGQVKYALQNYPCLELAEQMPNIGGPGLEGVGLTEAQCPLVQRFSPELGGNCNSDTIGFFIAKFFKVASCE